MNTTEIAQTVAKEQRDEISKFVYFLFSITTVSLGYAITQTQNIQPSYWLLVWGCSVIAMCCSLVFGVLYIHYNGQSLSHCAIALSLSDAIGNISKRTEEDLKTEIKRIRKSTIEASTLPEQRNLIIVKKLEESASANGVDFEKYVDSLPSESLRDILARLLYQSIGASSETETVANALFKSVKASRYLKKQMAAISAGYVLFFIWHIGTIFLLQAAPIAAKIP